MSTAALKTRGLAKLYGELVALEHLDWEVPRGTAWALLGSNGAGKTTTLDLLMAFTPPSEGSCEVLGEDPWNMHPQTRARIAYVSEQPVLPPWMRVGELVSFHSSFYPRWNRARERELLARFELPPRAVISSLSKGMNRRLMLLLALCQESELLLLDEPGAGLDVASRRELLGLLGEYLAEEGRSLVLSSHIVTDVERIVSHVAILREGRLIESAALDELHENVKTLRLPAALHERMGAAWDGAGVLSSELAGATRILTVRRFTALGEHLGEGGGEIEVLDMPLEDIFLALSSVAAAETSS